MNGKATRPSRRDDRTSWRQRKRVKEAKAENLPELMEKAEKDEPLFPEGDGDE